MKVYDLIFLSFVLATIVFTYFRTKKLGSYHKFIVSHFLNYFINVISLIIIVFYAVNNINWDFLNKQIF